MFTQRQVEDRLSNAINRNAKNPSIHTVRGLFVAYQKSSRDTSGCGTFTSSRSYLYCNSPEISRFVRAQKGSDSKVDNFIRLLFFDRPPRYPTHILARYACHHFTYDS